LATSFQLIAKHLNVLLPQTNKQADQDNFSQNTHKIKSTQQERFQPKSQTRSSPVAGTLSPV
jgi:hypothetical protein